jgi:hypothetical protein
MESKAAPFSPEGRVLHCVEARDARARRYLKLQLEAAEGAGRLRPQVVVHGLFRRHPVFARPGVPSDEEAVGKPNARAAATDTISVNQPREIVVIVSSGRRASKQLADRQVPSMPTGLGTINSAA